MKPSTNIGSHISKLKDNIATNDQSNVVSKYIGETVRELQTIINEHQSNVRNFNPRSLIA